MKMVRSLSRAALVLLALACAGGAHDAAAQGSASDGPPPAFTLSSSEVFTTRDDATFNLTFQHLTQLDFRVYRVRNAVEFFAGLRDAHQLGSDERPVPQERSWIERIADWKAARRRDVRGFLRGQVSPSYRANRRSAQDRTQVAQRVVLSQTSFAQVPLLNPDQLVTSWREMLPDYRDPEYRRVPLDVGRQPGVYLVEAVSGILRAYTIVIVSDIGIVTKISPGQLLVFAADRFTGEPKADCDIQVLADQRPTGSGRTAADGTALITLPDLKVDDIVGIARCGEHVAATDPGGWYLGQPQRQLLAYIYTDKPIYRPGHTVHIKSVLRWRTKDTIAPFDARQAEFAVSDLNDKVIFRREVPIDEFGAARVSFALPASSALGIYSIRVTSAGAEPATSSFDVQEYRRPEFEVIVTPRDRFVLQGGEAVAAVQARYYFGQPVANARVRYIVNRQPYYSPLRWDDSGDEGGGDYWYGGDQQLEGELRLDAQGRGEIRVPLDVDENGRDFSARIEAQVTDASSREVSGRTVVHATFGRFMLSARAGGYVFRAGQTFQTTTRALDYQGAPQPNVPVTFTLLRVTYPDGYYSSPTTVAVARTTGATAADGTATAALTLPDEPGGYRVRVSAPSDDRTVEDDVWIWLAGAQDETAGGDDRYLELIADKRTYQPGETARLIVRGDPVAGPMLATKEGQQVLWHQVLRPSAGDPIEVPITAADSGDVYVHIVFMRDGRLFRAERRLSVPATDKTLQITLTADRPTAKPQEPGVFTVNVTDASGAPVHAQLSLGVIDEAVYAIKPDDTPDPVRFFYRREYSRVGTAFSRNYYFVGHAGTERIQLAARKRRPFTLADFKGEKPAQPQVRKEFPDAIYWIADLVTDRTGKARVAITYPDALTTWRLTARAVTRDTRAGVAVARTTTTKDLIVRVITPRFLTEGDEVVVPTITHNYLEQAKATAVEFAATGLEPIAGTAPPATTTGVIASAGERRNEWRFSAPRVGTATVTATARTDSDGDAVELAVPIVPYGIARETGASGVLASGAEHTESVTIPAASNPASRLVSVSLAPSMAGSLLGALDYLTSFPYGCTEQTLSSFVPTVAVARTMAALQLQPTAGLRLVDRQVSDGLRRLADLQHDDGGWGWWKTDDNHPFMTAYAIYGLSEARSAGYQIDAYRLDNGARALAAMYATYPRAEPDLKAYMAYVLRRARTEGDTVDYFDRERGERRSYSHANALTELWAARTRLTSYGRALLLQLLDAAKDARGDEIARTLLGEARTEGELTWWPAERDALLFEAVETSVEATAAAVQALVRRDPAQPAIDRAVRWLLLNRRGGYWYSTKQTAMALYGLIDVLRARNETAQPFSVDVYVNGALAGSRSFSAADWTAPDPATITAPGREGQNDIRLVKKGAGSLYWSARGSYHDVAGAQQRSGTRALAINRTYARLTPVQERDRIVYREQLFDGRMNPGDVLSVRLTVAGSPDWRYLLIEDPLPAGVEAVQDTTAYPMEREDRWQWWWGSQVEYRDNRTVFFEAALTNGRLEYVYLVKAISSGQFRAVPARVTPMYIPDVIATSEPQTIVVNAPEPPR